MYISELKLWNFRKYGSNGSFDLNNPDLIVPLTRGLNVLIGENDSGKSAILDAIKLVLKTHAYEWIKVEKEDFNNETDKLRIELEFSGMSDDEAKHFIEWLGWENEKIEEGKFEKRPKLILIYQAEYRNNRVIPSDVKAGMDGTGHLLNADARDYLKCTYLKALRDADSELTAKKNSRLSQILQEHHLFKKIGGIKHDFENQFKLINDEITNDFKVDEQNKGYKAKIKDVIDDFIEGFIDDKHKGEFSFGNTDIKNILEKLSLGIEEQNGLGLGTMNRLYMATELLHLRKENWDGLKLCMIEELEAHLHPQAQMKIIEKLSKEKDIQFILTTHSPNIASKVDLKSLIICKNSDVFPMGEDYTLLGEEIKNGKYENSYNYLKRFLDVTKSNLFFAKGVIIVEGWSEEILIPEIAKKIKNDLTQNEISIINVGSVAYLHFAKVFFRSDNKDMKIPVAIITDLDLREYEREKQNNEYKYFKQDIKNHGSKLQEKEKEILDKENVSVKPFISSIWTFEWCLLKSESLSLIFKDVLKNIHSTTFSNCISEADWEVGLASILLSKSIKKTEIAYQLSEKIKTMTELNFKSDDTMYYLVKAIKHACNEN
ncbi:putative ATP-dependent endonuclease of OLD family [Flavobacterium arsenatis]|uniref:ATP-dependent endonuclease of OLD family n=1 Tax=Flavobacterium arsenatis TaxID=1484332 RepID=A0ABU1TM96_9FLAO|nr:AAA family ATPase [Flavobacterium arsenatis]MDR6966942.1 putative ATP-dependent endonuclease of OLD family [Flavobacterium arsenatis]